MRKTGKKIDDAVGKGAESRKVLIGNTKPQGLLTAKTAEKGRPIDFKKARRSLTLGTGIMIGSREGSAVWKKGRVV